MDSQGDRPPPPETLLRLRQLEKIIAPYHRLSVFLGNCFPQRQNAAVRPQQPPPPWIGAGICSIGKVKPESSVVGSIVARRAIWLAPIWLLMLAVKGAVKETIGKVVGDAKLEAEGKADKAEGKVQNAIGGLKDAARDAVKK